MKRCDAKMPKKRVREKDIKVLFENEQKLIEDEEKKNKELLYKIKNALSNIVVISTIIAFSLFTIFVICKRFDLNRYFIFLGFVVIPLYFLLKKTIKGFIDFFNRWRLIIFSLFCIVLGILFFSFVSYDIDTNQFYNLLILTWTVYSCLLVFITIWNAINKKKQLKLIKDSSELKQKLFQDTYTNILLIVVVIINIATTILYFWDINNLDNDFFIKPLLYIGGMLTLVLTGYVICSVFKKPIEIYFTIFAINKKIKKMEKRKRIIKKQIMVDYGNEPSIEEDYNIKFTKIYNDYSEKQEKTIEELLRGENEEN